jgi:hypothetical protein
LKKFIINQIGKSSLFAFTYTFVSGILSAIRKGKVKFLSMTWSSRENIVIYCNQRGHLNAVVDLINMISKNRNVLLLVSFDEELAKGLDEKVNLVGNFKQSWIILVKAKIFVTPVVGFPSHNRPLFSKTIHLMISLGSILDLYQKDHFDGYDYVFCAGPRQVEDLTTLFRDRNLNNKKLIKGGYPKLDLQIRKYSRVNTENRSGKTILYAPTHRVSGVNDDRISLGGFAKDIIATLLRANFNVIFRPHPVSFTDADREIIDDIEKEFSGNQKYSLDMSSDYMQSYSCADILLTDISGTAFTYAFTYLRPVIFFLPAEKSSFQESQFHADCLEIGSCVYDISDLSASCSNLIENGGAEDRILNFRSHFIYNLGRSSEYFVTCIDLILGEAKNTERVP